MGTLELYVANENVQFYSIVLFVHMHNK